MINRVLGVDIGTTCLAFALFREERLERAWWVGLPNDHVNRLAVAHDYAAVLPSNLVIVPEDPPMVRNSAVHRALCEVLGAFLAGCTHARWVHPGIPVTTWKKTSVGRGNATKADVAEWVYQTYPHLLHADKTPRSIVSIPTRQDVLDAIGIAHAGAAWWASRKQAA